MKSKVKFSIFSIIITALVLVLLIIGIFSLRGNFDDLVLFSSITVLAILSGLYYCPCSVEATSEGVKINRLLSGAKTFSYDEIEKVDACSLSISSLRLCGSGGFFGYWGYFHDNAIGNYFGYYGDKNYCMLLRLKNVRQYVLGCEDVSSMAKYISSAIVRRP